MKKYRLLKDINFPSYDTVKAGTIFLQHKADNGQTAYINGRLVLTPSTVLNNTDWFEEVTESACFTHEELREAFNAGRGITTINYATFEEYLGSRG